jgi:hypothetical protein
MLGETLNKTRIIVQSIIASFIRGALRSLIGLRSSASSLADQCHCRWSTVCGDSCPLQGLNSFEYELDGEAYCKQYHEDCYRDVGSCAPHPEGLEAALEPRPWLVCLSWSLPSSSCVSGKSEAALLTSWSLPSLSCVSGKSKAALLASWLLPSLSCV